MLKVEGGLRLLLVSEDYETDEKKRSEILSEMRKSFGSYSVAHKLTVRMP